jgi:hypothetical protein
MGVRVLRVYIQRLFTALPRPRNVIAIKRIKAFGEQICYRLYSLALRCAPRGWTVERDQRVCVGRAFTVAQACINKLNSSA